MRDYNLGVSNRIPLPLSAAWEDIWATAAEKTGVVGEAHLFLGILDSNDDMSAALLMMAGVSREEVRLYAQSWLDQGVASAEKKVEFSRGVSRVLRLASQEAQRDKSPFIEPHHFFIACVSHQGGAHLGEVLRPLGLDAAKLRAHLRRMRASQKPYPRGNPLNDLAPGSKTVIEAAHLEMRASYCGRISSSHLLLGLLSDAETAGILQNAGCDLEDLRKKARESIQSDGEIASPQKKFSPGAKRALERAAREAKLAGRKSIKCEDLLLGLLPHDETLGEKWRARGRELDSVEGLWTAEQAANLCGELDEAMNEDQDQEIGPHRDFRLTTSNPNLAGVLELSILSLGAAFCCALILSLTPQLNRTSDSYVLATWVVLAPAGVIFGIAGLTKGSARLINRCVGISAGWFLGMAAGFTLFH